MAADSGSAFETGRTDTPILRIDPSVVSQLLPRLRLLRSDGPLLFRQTVKADKANSHWTVLSLCKCIP